jgi:hypothetical protein
MKKFIVLAMAIVAFNSCKGGVKSIKAGNKEVAAADDFSQQKLGKLFF